MLSSGTDNGRPFSGICDLIVQEGAFQMSMASGLSEIDREGLPIPFYLVKRSGAICLGRIQHGEVHEVYIALTISLRVDVIFPHHLISSSDLKRDIRVKSSIMKLDYILATFALLAAGAAAAPVNSEGKPTKPHPEML
jgi:hypothetical protein